MSVPKIDLQLDESVIGTDHDSLSACTEVEKQTTGLVARFFADAPATGPEAEALADLRARAFVGLPRLLEACRAALNGEWRYIERGSFCHNNLRDAYLAIAEPEPPKSKTRAERIEEAAKEIAASRGVFWTPEGLEKAYRMVDADLLDKLMRAVNSEEGGAA